MREFMSALPDLVSELTEYAQKIGSMDASKWLAKVRNDLFFVLKLLYQTFSLKDSGVLIAKWKKEQRFGHCVSL